MTSPRNTALKSIIEYITPRGWEWEETKGGGIKCTNPQVEKIVFLRASEGSRHCFEHMRTDIVRAERASQFSYDEDKMRERKLEQARAAYKPDHAAKMLAQKFPVVSEHLVAPPEAPKPAEPPLRVLPDLSKQRFPEPIKRKGRAPKTDWLGMEPFPTVLVQVASQPGLQRTALFVTCSKCGAYERHRLSIKTDRKSGMAVIGRAFQAKGWTLAQKRSEDICSACAMDGHVAPKIAAPPPAARKEALSMTCCPTPTSTITTSSPARPQPTGVLRLRRRILKALDKAYVDPDIGYRAGESDKAVAARLDVLESDVAAVRSESFGPVHADSAKRDAARELRQLKSDLHAFQQNTLDAAAALETRIASVLTKLQAARLLEDESPSAAVGLNGAGRAA